MWIATGTSCLRDDDLKCHCEEKRSFDAAIQCAFVVSVPCKWIATGASHLRDDKSHYLIDFA